MIQLYKLAKCTAFASLLFLSPVVQADETVTNTNNSGPGSLAEAIANCNVSPGADVISFAIPGAAPFVINLSTPLPAITGPLFINGYSQAGATAGSIAGRTIAIDINGAGLPGGSDIFTIGSADVSIAGLAIYSAPRYQVNMLLGADNVHIWGNYIGTNETGTATGLGSGSAAIMSNSGAFGGDFNTGVTIGILDDNVNDAAEGNLICSSGGPEGDGIVFWNTRNSTVAGNIIGYNKNGAGTGFGNARHGLLITVSAENNTIGTDGTGISDALEGNLIGNNGGDGILLLLSDNNIIAGNRIGIDALDAAAGNTLCGIYLMNSSLNRIGTDGIGSAALEGNIICFNTQDGIRISSEDFFDLDGDANANVVAGNAIGTNAAGSLDGGNGASGVYLSATNPGYTANGNIIGSDFNGTGDALEGNLIHHNQGPGIGSNTPPANGMLVNNRFSRNSFANNSIGIDLGGSALVANDAGDTDNGPNEQFNLPVITSVQINGSNELVVTGFSRPNSVIEFYIADPGPTPNPLPAGWSNSFGEGQTFLFRGQDDGTTDVADTESGTTAAYDGANEGNGSTATYTEAVFSFTIPLSSLPAPVTATTRITALAVSTLSGAGNTSVFGPVASVASLPVHLLTFSARLLNSQVTLDWQTTDEVNNSHFEILKSTDGLQYAGIGQVAAQTGVVNNYSFTDTKPAAVNYYRLKQVDVDGRETLSKILTVRTDLGAVAAKASPNPFSSFIQLSYQLKREEQLHVRLFNLAGVAVRAYTIKGNNGLNTVSFSDLGNLPKGYYILELSGENGSFRQQVIKQ